MRLGVLCLVAFGVLVGGFTPALAEVKVAVINVQRILTDSEPGKQAQGEIEALQTAKRGELEGKQRELADLRKRIEDGRLSLAEDRLQELQKEFEDKAIAFRRAEDDANRELQKRGETLMNGIETKVLPVIQRIGKENGYTLVFNKFGSGLLYADDSVDITEQVIQEFNKAGG